MGEAYLTQQTARHALESAPTIAESPQPAPGTRALPDLRSIRNGTPLALLSIPRLDLSAVVLQGSDERTLRVGLGHIEQTAWLGDSGNVAIAGHRDSFFRPLRNIRIGDHILLETRGARALYRVDWFRVVASNDVGVIAPTGDASLTLVTCYPFFFIGSAPDRFVVRATRVDPPAGLKVARAEEVESPPYIPPTSVRTTTTAIDAPSRPAPNDDDALVRQALERFRATYNERLTRRGERDLLAFSNCQVAVTGATAAATCRLASTPTNASSSWTFTLGKVSGPERRDRAWAMKSVTMD